MWNSTPRKKLNFSFSIILYGYWQNVQFSRLSTKLWFLSLKSFSNSWGNSFIPCLLLIIAICFTFRGRKNLVKHQKVLKQYDKDNRFLLIWVIAQSVNNSLLQFSVYIYVYSLHFQCCLHYCSFRKSVLGTVKQHYSLRYSTIWNTCKCEKHIFLKKLFFSKKLISMSPRSFVYHFR